MLRRVLPVLTVTALIAGGACYQDDSTAPDAPLIEPIIFTVQPSTAAVDSAITPAVQVAIVDGSGKTDTTATNPVTMTIGTNPVGGNLFGTTTVNAVRGIATFANVRIDRVGSGYTLVPRSGTVTGAASAPFDVVGVLLVFAVQPSNAATGAVITPPVQVAATDTSGHLATGFRGTVIVTIGSNPAGGTLSGATGVAAVNGVATFANLSIDRAGAYTLTAATTGLVAGVSRPFSIGGAPALDTLSMISAAPASIEAGSGTSTISVTARDAAGNLLSGATVVLFATGTGNILTQPAGPTNASGVATGTLSSTVAETKAVSATVNGTTIRRCFIRARNRCPPVTAIVTVTPGAAVQLAFTTQPSDVAPGVVITPVVQVTARDAWANTATGFTQAVTLGIGTNPSGGTLSGTTSAAAANGVATFATLSIDKAGTGYTLVAATAGLTGATSAPFNVAPVASVSVTPGAVTLVPGDSQQLAATAKDAAGNVLKGLVVSWTSDNAAVATVSVTGLVRGVAPGAATVTATSEGQSGTAAITVTPAPLSAAVSVRDTAGHVLFKSDRNASSNPAVDTVTVGGTVTWTWFSYDSLNHSVQSVGTPSFPSSAVQASGTYSFTFTAAGTYSYDCAVHGTLMTGIIVVR